MTESDPINDIKSTVDLDQSPGEMLAQAREEKGLTRIGVSELLGLTQSMVRDIELCRFEQFPTGVYTRGYIRNYCKLVEANEAQVLSAYDRYGETNEIPEAQPFGSAIVNIPKERSKQKTVFLTLLGIVIIGIVAWLVFS